MVGKLRVVTGPDSGSSYTLQPGAQGLIGRGDGCDIRMSDKSVSRKHCQLHFNGEVASIVDLESTVGTFVNGTRVHDADLGSGDVLGVGASRLAFLLSLPGTESAEPPKQSEDTLPPNEAVVVDLPEDLGQLSGRQFLRYEVGDVICKARSGVVFSATDLSRKDRVALKIFWPDYTGDRVQAKRFLRAVRTMLPVKHENLVRLRAAGAVEKHCFTASEFVDGDSAASLIEKFGIAGRLNWQKTLAIATGVAKALEAAEGMRVVHRNVTPTNILVSHDGVAKLGDLVLAKALEGTQYEEVTRPGETVGELSYMAPEQLADARLVDSRTDFYNFGATIYALLTGKPPHEADTTDRTINKIKLEDPEPPSARQLGIPGTFEGIVLKCLSKRREDRYQNATKLVDDLEKVSKYAT